MKKRILSFLLAVLMIVGVFPFAAFAENAPANGGTTPTGGEGGTEPTDGRISFIGPDGVTVSIDDYTLIDEDTVLWEDGYYVAVGDVTLSGYVKVDGTASLILTDGAHLTVAGDEFEPGIYVPEGSALNIYSQSASSGKLFALGGDLSAGIGGRYIENSIDTFSVDCGIVNIYGGSIKAVGGFAGAGIGGGWSGSAESISILGGVVIAECDSSCGSAIGAGEDGDSNASIHFVGGYTHASGNIAVSGKVTVAAELDAYDFDTPQQQYSSDCWRVGYKGNPSVDVLIGPCTYFDEKGHEKHFYEINPDYNHIQIYDGETTINGGIYFVMEDFTPSTRLTVSEESQFVLADGVTVDFRVGGRKTFGRISDLLYVFTTSTGDAQGRVLGARAYDEEGKAKNFADFTIYNGETTLAAGTYYVTKDYEIEGPITATGAVKLIITDRNVLKAGLFMVENGGSFAFYTESLGSEKGAFEGIRIDSGTYLDENGAVQNFPDGIKLYNGESNLASGWYIFWGKGLNGRLEIGGDVKIILIDGTTTNISSGITLSSGHKLTIFAQSYSNEMGTLNANKKYYASTGIGTGDQYFGGHSGGTLVINGGFVNAYGASSGAGIGGGYCGNGCDVTVNGGVVTAEGGSGAGIGGGAGVYLKEGFVLGQSDDFSTNGGKLTVNGGIVKAKGSYNAAAIGGGFNGTGANLTINGGTVIASATQIAIGGGERRYTISSSTKLASDMVGYVDKGQNGWFSSSTFSTVLSKSPYNIFITSKNYYLSDGTPAAMSNPKTYSNQSVLTSGEWYVGSSVTLKKPLLISGDVTLVLADGVKFDATLDVFFTEEGSFRVGTASTGMRKGVFTGNVYEAGGEGGGENVPTDMLVHNGETLLRAAYLVSDSFEADEPLVIDGAVSLFIVDDVVFSAPKGYVMTKGSTLDIYYMSDNANHGVFDGEKLTRACGKNLGDYVTLYTGQNCLDEEDGWYYVRRDVTPKTGVLVSADTHIIIPDGVSIDVPKGIYVTEHATLEVCPLSDGADAGQMTGTVIEEYLSENGNRLIPDGTVVFDPKSPSLGNGSYLVLASGTANVISLENENTLLLIADNVTLTASVGYFGSEPAIGTFSTGADAGQFVGSVLTYLNKNGESVILPADAHFYDGQCGIENPLDGGFWFVGRSMTVNERIAVTGDVTLVLGDGVKLEANKGINVPFGTSLTITSQSDGERMGELYAYTLRYGRHTDAKHYESGEYDIDGDSAIGGGQEGDEGGSNNTFGSLEIINGYVEAHAFEDGSAIGAAFNNDGGDVLIEGGVVRAYGYNSEYVVGGGNVNVSVTGGNVFVSDDSTDGSDYGIGANTKITGGDVRIEGNFKSAIPSNKVNLCATPMRAFDIKGHKIYSEEDFFNAGAPIASVRFFDASYLNEEGKSEGFSEGIGRILTPGDETLEADVWYYATDDVRFSGKLTVEEGAYLIIGEGVTVSTEGVILPASGTMNLYMAYPGENKGQFIGKTYLPYVDGEGNKKALPTSVDTYEGYTELPYVNRTDANDPLTNSAWYYVDENYTLTEPLVIRGSVTLVIADGVTLDASSGIVIEENGELNVYYTSDGDEKGALIGEEKGYFDENGSENRLPDGFITYNGETTLESGWFLVKNDVEVKDVLTISGDVKLVLADGVTLTAKKGVLLTSGNKLTVSSMSTGNEMGGITAYGGDLGVAGIGGNYNNRTAGDLTVNGGKIKAYGSSDAAGIGGGAYGKSGTIVFNGGMIEAEGSAGSAYAANAAGIGGGYSGGITEIVINGVVSLHAVGGRAIGSGIGAEQAPELIVLSDDLTAYADGTAIETIGDETDLTIIEGGVHYTGASLTLADDVNLNFYMALPQGAVETGTMEFTVGSRTLGGEIKLNAVEDRYYFTCPVTVLEMATEVTATFSYGGVDYVKTFSVKDYVTEIVNGDFPAEMKTLAKKLANYGYYTQNYLESIHTNVTIDRDGSGEGYPEMLRYADCDLSVADVTLTDGFAAPADTDNLTFDGRTVYFESATALNYYVVVSDGTAPTAICAEGKEVEVKLYKGNTYVVSVKNITATELNTKFTVTVNGAYELKSSVLDYCAAVMNAHSGKTENKDAAAVNAMAAFYEYHAAALAFVSGK